MQAQCCTTRAAFYYEKVESASYPHILPVIGQNGDGNLY
jgi:hypothetical protein